MGKPSYAPFKVRTFIAQFFILTSLSLIPWVHLLNNLTSCAYTSFPGYFGILTGVLEDACVECPRPNDKAWVHWYRNHPCQLLVEGTHSCLGLAWRSMIHNVLRASNATIASFIWIYAYYFLSKSQANSKGADRSLLYDLVGGHDPHKWGSLLKGKALNFSAFSRG